MFKLNGARQSTSLTFDGAAVPRGGPTMDLRNAAHAQPLLYGACARARVRRVAVVGVVGGIGQHGSQPGRLVLAELARADLEVMPRRRFGAEDVGAPLGDIQI